MPKPTAATAVAQSSSTFLEGLENLKSQFLTWKTHQEDYSVKESILIIYSLQREHQLLKKTFNK